MKERWKDPNYVEFQKNHPSMKNRFGKDNPAAVAVNIEGKDFDTKRAAAKHFNVSMTTITRWIENGRGKIK